MIWFWEVLTSEWLSVLSQWTKTSSLFMINRGGAWHEPMEELTGRDSAQLAHWFCGRHKAKEHPCQYRHTIYRVGLPKEDSSNDICGVITPNTPSPRNLGWHIWCHGLGNAFWQKHQKTFPSPWSQNYTFLWGRNQGWSLSNTCTGTYQYRKVSCILQDNFDCYTCIHL